MYQLMYNEIRGEQYIYVIIRFISLCPICLDICSAQKESKKRDFSSLILSIRKPLVDSLSFFSCYIQDWNKSPFIIFSFLFAKDNVSFIFFSETSNQFSTWKFTFLKSDFFPEKFFFLNSFFYYSKKVNFCW